MKRRDTPSYGTPLARVQQLEGLATGDFDVLVIGGGISGAAVARDAARRGFRTALIEAVDFACGTSSRSSRLVHGGLRYLENFEFDLVFEASQERRTLLRIAPHLVRPLEFTFPIFEDSRVGKLKLDAGMWLYDALSFFRNIERHQMFEPEELIKREPGIRRKGLLGGARYFDAQVDDARLVMMTVIAALESGAIVTNRAEVCAIDSSDWPGHRVVVEDRERGKKFDVDTLAIVNATGAWAEQTLMRAEAEPTVRITPSRGTHIHVKRDRVGHDGAFIFEAPQDGRIMFVLPWREDLTLIGTTDEFYDGKPEDVAATPTEIAYLLEATNRLFPQAKLRSGDVLSAWAGLRPLVQPEEGLAEPGTVSREFEIREGPTGVFTLSGGKLTSHRHMAEKTVDRLQRFLGRAGISPTHKVDTAKTPLPGGTFDTLDALRADVRTRANASGVGRVSADRLTRAYGTRAYRVLELVKHRPELRHLILEDRPHILAEVLYAVQNELALHVEDVLYRRTRIGLETRNKISVAAQRVANVMGTELGWSSRKIAQEIEDAVQVRTPDDAAIAQAMI